MASGMIHGHQRPTGPGHQPWGKGGLDQTWGEGGTNETIAENRCICPAVPTVHAWPLDGQHTASLSTWSHKTQQLLYLLIDQHRITDDRFNNGSATCTLS